MSPSAASKIHITPKVHHSEYIVTNSDPDSPRLAVPRMSKYAEQRRIDAMNERMSRKHLSFIGDMTRFLRV